LFRGGRLLPTQHKISSLTGCVEHQLNKILSSLGLKPKKLDRTLRQKRLASFKKELGRLTPIPQQYYSLALLSLSYENFIVSWRSLAPYST